MKRDSSYSSRNSSSVGGPPQTPESSVYSSSHKSTSSVFNHNPVKTALQSFLHAIISCFTPPQTPSYNSFELMITGSCFKKFQFGIAPFFPSSFFSRLGDQPVDIISREDESDISHEGSEKNHGSSGGVYGKSSISTHVREPGSVKFTMAEIYKATKNFSPTLKIGQGGFGTVYRGRLDDGTLVAIKRAKKNVYEKHVGVEFRSEVQTLAHVEHLNLVKFYGYLEQDDEKVVVVEYVPNGTLRDHLDCTSNNVLDFAARLDIAIDVAHAVTYLHVYTDHPIIHRDIKSSNILLTENLRAKVADFGFARLGADSDSGDTHVSTQVKGTAGYLDPEYLRTYQLTVKSDVYSFGVLLVELVTGRRPIEPKKELKERITPRWAIKKFTDGDALSTLDPRLEQSAANNFGIEKILELALQCLAPHRYDRPTMRRCAKILWTIRKDYKEIVSLDSVPLPSHPLKSSSVKTE